MRTKGVRWRAKTNRADEEDPQAYQSTQPENRASLRPTLTYRDSCTQKHRSRQNITRCSSIAIHFNSQRKTQKRIVRPAYDTYRILPIIPTPGRDPAGRATPPPSLLRAAST